MQEKKIFLHRKEPSAEFRRPQTAKKGAISKIPRTCASEFCLLSLQTCERSECAAAGCFPSRKCLHFRECIKSSGPGILSPRPMEVEGMIEQDTIRLLRECDAGVQMGTESIQQVLPRVESGTLKQRLEKCRAEHQKLSGEIHGLLDRYQDEGKAPPLVAKGMSWAKTNLLLAADGNDSRIAGLMTDGCNMGVKSLNKYLNQYEAAQEWVKDIAKRLIQLEEQLAVDLRDFL